MFNLSALLLHHRFIYASVPITLRSASAGPIKLQNKVAIFSVAQGNALKVCLDSSNFYYLSFTFYYASNFHYSSF